MYGLPGIVLGAGILAILALARKSRFRTVRYLLITVAVGLLWCLFVHRVYDILTCRSCHLQITQAKIEIFRKPVLLQEHVFPSLRTAVAEDFDCPCQHAQLDILKRDDEWGMCVRIPGDSYSILSLESDEEGYRTYVRPIVVKIRQERPDLAKEFCRRVIEQQDEEYWTYFYEKVLRFPEIQHEYSKREPKRK